ncbi:hypothetical protein CCACVL1_07142 [Corchorus capsularis]|uniref:Uncharacterized protein n=1 Tax=Corchorus capsularis TaxID=210143 RepID=A0A1R3J937_COCAP|nr:hypothetical protein CCACVL1_07142 [Corchorus capsularis]
MADLGFFSDTDESAVEEVISQAKDLCVLEQLSALNCSSFSDSVLPSDLDSRFRRLKSFPVTLSQSHTTYPKPKPKPKPDEDHLFDSIGHSPRRKYPFKPNPKPDEDHLFDSIGHSPRRKHPSKPNQRPSSPPPVSDSSSTSSRSIASSPPQKTGCFWCSPKRLSKKNNKDRDRMLGDEFVSDLASFSLKETQKILNEAIKEQDKINREAEKIVNWAKQASMRMASPGPGIENELSHSDDEDDPAK